VPATELSRTHSPAAPTLPPRRRGASAPRRPVRQKVSVSRASSGDRARPPAPKVVADGLSESRERTGGDARRELLLCWVRALDSAYQAVHSARGIGVFEEAEARERERGIQGERAWLRSLLDDVARHPQLAVPPPEHRRKSVKTRTSASVAAPMPTHRRPRESAEQQAHSSAKGARDESQRRHHHGRRDACS
jgi:hypothetical protein